MTRVFTVFCSRMTLLTFYEFRLTHTFGAFKARWPRTSDTAEVRRVQYKNHKGVKPGPYEQHRQYFPITRREL